MNDKLQIAAIIFDLDGLVLDSEAGYFVAWQRAAADMGQTLDADFCAALSGLHGRQVQQRLQQHCGVDFDLKQFAALSRQHWLAYVEQQPIPIKPGFAELLSLIQQLDLGYALATNSRRLDVEFCLDNAGLGDAFPLKVCRDDVVHGKPAPDSFQQAALLLGVSPRACLVLEDSPIGVSAAVAAGAPCIYVPSLLPADEIASARALRRCDDLRQVADFVSAQLGGWL